MAGHFSALLASLVENPDGAADELPIILPEEARAIVGEWNDTRSEYPRDSSVHRLFESVARKRAGFVAVFDGAQTVTYAELNARANGVARTLVAAGAQPGDRIAIALPRSAAAVAAILGVLKTGGAYLMLDPDDGCDRNRELLRDCGARLTLGPREVDAALAHAADENLPWDGDGSDPGYIMYTSGSTGRPKGVVAPHRAISRLVLNTNYVEIRPSDRIAQISTLLFDASTFELLAPY